MAALRRVGSHLERRRALVRNAVVSRDEIEQAETDLVRAQSEVARIDAALERAASLSAAASAQARAAAARLDDAVVLAPADGVVIAREANPGDTVAPGAPIYRLVDPASLIVEARFDESVLGLLGPGIAAEVRFTSDPRQPIQGRITRLHREVDPATREFTVEIALSSLPRNWALGQRATVLVRAAGDLPVLAIDQRFLARRDGRPGVWRVEDGRARWRPVGLGMPAGDWSRSPPGWPRAMSCSSLRAATATSRSPSACACHERGLARDPGRAPALLDHHRRTRCASSSRRSA